MLRVMIDPNLVRDRPEHVRAGLGNRGLDPDSTLQSIAAFDAARRRVIPELETLNREQNESADAVGRAKRAGQDTTALQEASRQRAQRIKQLNAELDAIEQERTAALLTLPNLPH